MDLTIFLADPRLQQLALLGVAAALSGLLVLATLLISYNLFRAVRQMKALKGELASLVAAVASLGTVDLIDEATCPADPESTLSEETSPRGGPRGKSEKEAAAERRLAEAELIAAELRGEMDSIPGPGERKTEPQDTNGRRREELRKAIARLPLPSAEEAARKAAATRVRKKLDVQQTIAIAAKEGVNRRLKVAGKKR